MVDILNHVWIRTFARLDREEGQALTEYALVIVIVGTVGALVLAWAKVSLFGDIKSAIEGVFPIGG